MCPELRGTIDMFIFTCSMASITWMCRKTFYPGDGDVGGGLETWFNVCSYLIPHLTGFAGFELTKTILDVAFEINEEGSLLFNILLLLMMLIVIRLMCHAMDALRKQKWYAEGLDETSQDELKEVIEEGEDEATAFIMSGALYGFANYYMISAIDCSGEKDCGCTFEHTGELHLVAGKLPQGCDRNEVWRQWAICAIPAVLILVLATYGPVYERLTCCGAGYADTFKRAVGNLKRICGMLTCRLVLGMVIHWTYWRFDNKAAVHMFTALFTTTLAIFLTFWLDSVADVLEKKETDEADPDPAEAGRGAEESDPLAANAVITPGTQKTISSHLFTGATAAMNVDANQAKAHLATSTRGLIGIFGLLVGLSWEAVFDEGEKDLVRYINESLLERKYFTHSHTVMLHLCFTFTILLVVVPNWGKYVIPLAKKDRKYHQDCIDAEAKEEARLSMCSKEVRLKLCQSFWPRCWGDSTQPSPAGVGT